MGRGGRMGGGGRMGCVIPPSDGWGVSCLRAMGCRLWLWLRLWVIVAWAGMHRLCSLGIRTALEEKAKPAATGLNWVALRMVVKARGAELGLGTGAELGSALRVGSSQHGQQLSAWSAALSMVSSSQHGQQLSAWSAALSMVSSSQHGQQLSAWSAALSIRWARCSPSCIATCIPWCTHPPMGPFVPHLLCRGSHPSHPSACAGAPHTVHVPPHAACEPHRMPSKVIDKHTLWHKRKGEAIRARSTAGVMVGAGAQQGSL